MPMATHRDAVLAFGLLLACAASVMAAIGWQAFIGFVLGVTTALAAAAIASVADFE